MPDTRHPGHSHRHTLKAIARRAMIDYGFEPDFPGRELAELASVQRAALPAAPPARDLRALLWCSIDNDDTRDIDQLTVTVPGRDGGVRLLVAIADVDSLVPKDSAIDEHARRNTTSIYTPAEIFWMLPEKLSAGLTSLSDHQDRSAIVVDMEFDADGSRGDVTIDQAIVRNRAKLAYDSVSAWLDGQAPAPDAVAAEPGMDEQLRVQDRLAQQLRAFRREHGALDLRTIEAKAVFDGDTLLDLAVDQRNRARDLIEDFMIAANGATARFLDAHGLPSLRRVVRSPERWPRIVELAAQLGTTLPAEADAEALEAFLVARRRADAIGFPDLSQTIVKLLGSGEYVAERPGAQAPGHFSLAVRDYTHSTAPNRRYPDLITQRLLKGTLDGRSAPYRFDELEQLARHCTDCEDAANRVERLVRKSAAALLLTAHIGERFDGIVTGASEKGTWVRIFHPPAEGKVVAGEKGLDVGDRVRVKLLNTDVDRGFIDFARA
ncbi:MAG TPA: RNB domain-containing ribonuclease [Vicinamibacterales bacterium]|nr:RNB domain-containing ribonuclease [Vicinamibacterales bacterium]